MNSRLLFILAILGFLFISFDICAAKEDELIFDDRVSYDIYLGNYPFDSRTVIRDVEIIKIQEIHGKVFLVIQPHGFNLKEANGFILFDSISAILPKSEFRVTDDKRKIIRK